MVRLGWWVEGERGGRGLLAESDDESEDGNDELRHADPEGCLVHDATASLGRSLEASGSRETWNHCREQKHAAYGIGLRVTRHPRMGAVEQP